MKDITLVKNIAYANAITHAGEFHADEVLAAAILSKIIKPLKLYRTDIVPKYVDSSIIIFGMGFGKFDYHRENRKFTRDNGIPYSSAGLIWKEFGPRVVAKESNPFLVWNFVDKDFIQGIDAEENHVVPNVKYPVSAINFNQIISSFNSFYYNKENSDLNFINAVNLASTVFDNAYAIAVEKSKAKQIVEVAIYKSSNHIMLLEEFVPWKEFVADSHNIKSKDILFVIYPSKNGGYVWECVPKKSLMLEVKKPAPMQWRGLKKEALRAITGIKTATFCNADGVCGGAETFEDTIKFVKLVLED